jgi:hypothetical protein
MKRCAAIIEMQSARGLNGVADCMLDPLGQAKNRSPRHMLRGTIARLAISNEWNFDALGKRIELRPCAYRSWQLASNRCLPGRVVTFEKITIYDISAGL